ncbi:MAG: hypothetical protein HY326_07180, partial [Chloroflexi bacterium]|nr:hypothetical protein [Chloroflexota bacterium]
MAQAFPNESSTTQLLATKSPPLTTPTNPYQWVANYGLPICIHPALMTELLEEVKGSGEDRAATPLLEMLVGRLLEEEKALWQGWSRPQDGAIDPAELTLRLETYQRLGGAPGITKEHLYAILAGLTPVEQEAATRAFHHLVTPSGKRIRQSRADLAGCTGLPDMEFGLLLQKLAGADRCILRATPASDGEADLPGYEISHDLWAAAIQDWQRDYLERQEKVAGDQRRMQESAIMEKRLSQRRWQVRSAQLRRGGTSLLFALIISLGVFAWQQRNDVVNTQAAAYARETDARAQHKLGLSHLSRALAANALLQLPTDPELGLLLAIEGLKTATSPQTEDALREALAYQTPIYSPLTVLSGHTHIVNHATFSPDGSQVLTTSFDGTAIIWQASTGKPIVVLRGPGARVLNGLFSPDGQSVRTVNEDGTITIWDPHTGQNIRMPEGIAGSLGSVAFSRDGKWIVTTSGLLGRMTAPDARNLPSVNPKVQPPARSNSEFHESYDRSLNAPITSEPPKSLGPLALNNYAFITMERSMRLPSEKSQVQVWATGTDMVTAPMAMMVELPENLDAVWNAAFSPDNQRVVIVSNTGS